MIASLSDPDRNENKICYSWNTTLTIRYWVIKWLIQNQETLIFQAVEKVWYEVCVIDALTVLFCPSDLCRTFFALICVTCAFICIDLKKNLKSTKSFYRLVRQHKYTQSGRADVRQSCLLVTRHVITDQITKPSVKTDWSNLMKSAFITVFKEVVISHASIITSLLLWLVNFLLLFKF